jgi:arylsulfatase A-like enzyme
MKKIFIVLPTALLIYFYGNTAPVEKLNFVIILADDLGYGDVHCYNPRNGKILTPSIDQLASQGIRFTDAHSSSGVCSPSRYTLLTGRYHWRTRLQSGIVGVFGDPLITPGRLTIGRLAKQHGYHTACIGKWHLGWDWPIPGGKKDLFAPGEKNVMATDDHRRTWQEVFSQRIPGGPTAVGFNEYFGTDVPNWPPYCFIENDRTVGIPSEFGAGRLFGKSQASLQGPSLENWKLENILPALIDHSVSFIERMAKSSTPFLLYLPLTSPHTPLAVNKEWKGKSGLGSYADLVMETDAMVKKVLEALDKNNIVNNTIVIFTSDNGFAPYVGDTTPEEAMDTTYRNWPWKRDQHDNMPVAALERKGHYPSGPFRGYKSDAWEGGHRVPFIVRWPGVVKPGQLCSQLIHHADLLRTFANILGSKLPDNAGEDSFSFLPLLKGSDRPIRSNAVSASSGGIPAVRLGNWKYIPAPGSGGWSPGVDQSMPEQLYNLAGDMAESKNLAAGMPRKVAEMKALLEKIISDGRSTPGKRQMNDVEIVRYPVDKNKIEPILK